MERAKLVKRAIALGVFTVVYNLVEGGVSIGFGIAEESISLFGFGVDSLIEVASALLVLWRLQCEKTGSLGIQLKRERLSTGGIGVLFIILAAVIVTQSFFQIMNKAHPLTTLPGLIISLASLSFMFFLWQAKIKVGKELDSSTVIKDASCSLACIKLSVILFAGSILFLFDPSVWWADSVAAIFLASFFLKEGWGTLRSAMRPDFSGGCCCCNHPS